MVNLANVSKSFGSVRAVEDVTTTIPRGEFVALLGPSGCGKTTLLRLVAGLEHPDRGAIALAGTRVAADGAVLVAPERRGVGMVFQDYALFPNLTVAANVAFGLPKAARERRVAEVLALVGLRGLEERFPHELSGGQQQRVALARAIAPSPSIVLLDEPWSNIDSVLRASMRDELAAILRSLAVTVVLVTHDREEAFALADRIVLMQDGRVVQDAAPEELYLRPATRWAAEFVGAANFVTGVAVNGHVETAFGRFRVANHGPQGPVEVLLRPESVLLEPSADGPGRIVEREFRGHDVFYRVDLGEGVVLASQRPSNEFVPSDARVRISTAVDAVTVF
jgi:iron(III) transport system ATP-binding protein